MANNVFANGREISCKKADGKTICEFPDVCFTPPENPATPPGVPVPYPNTAFAKDTTDGSKNVKISGQEVMLKNKSYFKTSTGDEAGCAAKKGIISSTNKGKAYFISWSMDVKAEGENVVRHIDMTTHNHASPMATGAIPGPHIDSLAAFGDPPECAKQTAAAKKKCKNAKLVFNEKGAPDGMLCSKKCKKAMHCILVPKSKDKEMCCKPYTTGHHLVEDNWVKGNNNFPWYRSNRGNSNFTAQSVAKGQGPGIKTVEDAPCVCADNIHKAKGNHVRLHNTQGAFAESYLPGNSRHVAGHQSGGFTLGEGKKVGMESHKLVFKHCPSSCIKGQLDAFYGDDDDAPLNAPNARNPGGSKANREKVVKKFPRSVGGGGG